MLVLTQYKAASLDRHIHSGWNFLSRDLGECVDVIPPQQRVGDFFYRGTADAIYQNVYSIERINPDLCLILGGDHIYKMNYRRMLDFHEEKGADLTIACLPVPRAEARRFGVMAIDAEQRIVDFREKPDDPAPMPGQPDCALASMGIYVFNARLLYEKVCEDAVRPGSDHDFGKNIIPALIGDGKVFAYPFRDENGKDAAYWRDIGTLDDFYDCNMDLVRVEPVLNLYDRDWPIRTAAPQDPPAKFVFSEEGRRGMALDSIVCAGAIVSGAEVRGSILSRRTRVGSHAQVTDSILFEDVEIGRHAVVRRAILDKDVKVPPHATLGVDLELDRRRGFAVSERGVVVVPRGAGADQFRDPAAP